MTRANWWIDIYPGVPMAVQLALLIAFILILSTLFNTILLKFAAISHVRERLPPAPESDHLWVFMVPALNEQVTIADSVARLDRARATHKLILVIDDGSDDSTPTILEQLDADGLVVLRRDHPDARRGKAAALNAAWHHLHQLLDEPQYTHWPLEQVIVVIVDADGRLSANSPAALARHFVDPDVGGVQSLVRIYNRRNWLTWAQDVEFAIFGRLYQSGRTKWGTANMGGNGQANRLTALDSVATDEGPWRHRLTEDQDVGVRLMQEGWKGRQDLQAIVEQQGVSSLARLYRQRTRWSQGAWQSITLLSGIRRVNCSWMARLDIFMYLLTPLVQLLVGGAFAMAVALSIFGDFAIWARTVPVLLFFLSLSFLPGIIGLMSRSRGLGSKLLSIFLIVPYTIYSWIIFPVVLTALRRTVLGHSTWAKTAREPLVDGVHAQVTADP